MVRKSMSVSWPLAFGDAFQGSLTGKDNARLISRVYGVDFEKTLSQVEDFAELGVLSERAGEDLFFGYAFTSCVRDFNGD